MQYRNSSFGGLRKLIKAGIFIVFILSLFGFRTYPVRSGGCVNWCAPTCVKETRDPITNACTQWVTLCCDTGSLGGQRCDAGYYSCNITDFGQTYSGCCPVGSGGGGGGGTGMTCPDGTYESYSSGCFASLPYAGYKASDACDATGGCRNPAKPLCGGKPVCVALCDGMTAPHAGKAVNITSTTATLKWKNGSGGRYRNLIFNGQTITLDPAAPMTSVTFNDLTPNTTYFWSVQEYKSDKEWLDFGNICTTALPRDFTTNPNQTSWWQVKDGDASTNGDLNSTVPAGSYFGEVGSGGFPGIPSYGGTTNLSSTTVNANGWMVNSTNQNGKTFNYNYFTSLIPSDVTFADGATIATPVAEQYGYEWYKYTSIGGLPLTLSSALDLGARKVILLVDSADFYINAPISLTDGQGFFMTAVGGDILVNSSVNNLEGLYESDGVFYTGSGSTQLTVRGSVAGYDGVSMQRTLADNATPAEIFEYAPDQILLFPSKLATRKINWKEVAP